MQNFRVEVVRTQRTTISIGAHTEEELYEALRDPQKVDGLFNDLLQHSEHVGTTMVHGDVLSVLTPNGVPVADVYELGFAVNDRSTL